MEKIFAIVRVNGSKELRMIEETASLNSGRTALELDKEVEKERWYSNYMGTAYSSYIDSLPCPKNMTLEQWRNSNSYKSRLEIVAFFDTIERIQKKYDTVAISHRKGGFESYHWNFNDDIEFKIFTNFGYGSVSYFHLSYYYKGLMLTPYSKLIKFRYADYNSIVSYTNNYMLDYEEWKTVMKDALDFYNSIVRREDHHIFDWLRHQLEEMTKGLENYVNASTIYFDNNYSISFNKEKVTDEKDVYNIKSFKIAESLKFIENIKKLPVQVNPDSYASRIEDVCKRFMSIQDTYINSVDNKIEQLQKDIDKMVQGNVDLALALNIYKKKWALGQLLTKEITNDTEKATRKHFIELLASLSGLKELKNVNEENINTLISKKKKYDEKTSEMNSKKCHIKVLRDYRESIMEYFNKEEEQKRKTA